MTDHSPFKPVGEIALGVIIDLQHRKDLLQKLKTSLVVETARKNLRDDARAKEIAIFEAKKKIAQGVNDLQQNDGPEAVIKYLRDTLAAIGGNP